MSTDSKVGLVLSGGGAKGAYQVGVVRALRELGIEVNAIAGASIGALNGAVLASAGSVAEGADRLDELWRRLASDSPLKLKSFPSYITLLLSSGLKLTAAPALDKLFMMAEKVRKYSGKEIPVIGQIPDSSLLKDEPLRALMERFMDPAALENGIPLYASVYKSAGISADLKNVFLAQLGVSDTDDSDFFHIQSLPVDAQKEVLLASAALPLLFSAREFSGEKYTDGGQGGWLAAQGNTPITPLLNAGCNFVIVTHLSDGSNWDRHAFPEATILEIRPQSSFSRSNGVFGGAKDLLGFDGSKIPSWIEQGYQDTMHCVGRVASTLKVRSDLKDSEVSISRSEEDGQDADAALRKAMSRLS